jgi:hypothetical protein
MTRDMRTHGSGAGRRNISLYELDLIPPGPASPLTYRALSSRTAGRRKWEGKGGEGSHVALEEHVISTLCPKFWVYTLDDLVIDI